MDTESIAAKPVTYNDVAGALTDIAIRVRDAQFYDRPLVEPYVTINIVPRSVHADFTPTSEEDRVRTVDAVARELFGRDGTREPSGSRWCHRAAGKVGPVEVSVHTSVTAPPPDEVQAELIRLRAENEALRRDLADDEVPSATIEGASL